MTRRRIIPCLAATVAAALLPAAPVTAADMVPNEVVVKRTGEAPTVKKVRSVHKALAALRRSDRVEYAAPNPVARASAFIPNDPGRGRGWQAVQWNFLAEFGVNAPDAWQHLIDAGAPGGRGVVVAVLDSGVAYADRGPFRQSPDFNQTRFVQGYDFVAPDPFPNDENGHGTHVAGTIAESTDNRVGLTGLAYGASIMPVRVLDEEGEGDAATIADGVRFAVRRGADVVNLSLEFSTEVQAREIPSLLDALAFARRRGVLVVGAAGNEGDHILAFPARSSNVFSVGATTEHGCLSDYSNLGRNLDIVAPGGGGDALENDSNCRPDEVPGRPIHQLTFVGGSLRRFGLPGVYEGTSMAAPHVSAAAALVIASRVLGADPTPERVIAHLKATARDLGPRGVDKAYGAGLLDAAAATDPGSAAARRARTDTLRLRRR
ncbi:MAG TPA: S8 family serine peptidase [Solirubrobacteraceae bacterium]|nr:S8 family serine peptidase [Solirubrobacteraceae bacterium]